jgi:hypothetical protein
VPAIEAAVVEEAQVEAPVEAQLVKTHDQDPDLHLKDVMTDTMIAEKKSTTIAMKIDAMIEEAEEMIRVSQIVFWCAI